MEEMTPKEEEFYDIFFDKLPEGAQEDLDEQAREIQVFYNDNYCERPDRLPTIVSPTQAKLVLTALEEAYDDYLPPRANPFRIIESESLRAYPAIEALHLSYIHMLSEYYPEDNSLKTLGLLLYRSTRCWSTHFTFYDQQMHGIKYGFIGAGTDEATNGKRPEYSSLYNHCKKMHVKDFERTKGEGLPLHPDNALRNYERFRHLEKELKEDGCGIDVIGISRLPFAYMGITEQFMKEKWVGTYERNLMRSDLLTLEANKMRDVFEDAVEQRATPDLFAQIQIEALLRFLSDPDADASQKKKYLAILKTKVAEFSGLDEANFIAVERAQIPRPVHRTSTGDELPY